MSQPELPLPAPLLWPLIDQALQEDLGTAGDITTLACIPRDRQAAAEFLLKTDGTVAGLSLAAEVFRRVDPGITVDIAAAEGSQQPTGTTLLTARGSARSLLTAERTALNLAGHLSGIATATARLVALVEGTAAQIACTRKTLPGLRALQKYAVRCGGGMNHRFGLHDAVMIKDNHIIAAGGITAALRAAKDYAGHTVKIEIEVDTLDQLEDVLSVGADIVLLDNMTPAQLQQAVALAKGQAVLEASGGVTEGTVREIAETGVDIISVGALTHSVTQADIGMDLELV